MLKLQWQLNYIVILPRCVSLCHRKWKGEMWYYKNRCARNQPARKQLLNHLLKHSTLRGCTGVWHHCENRWKGCGSIRVALTSQTEWSPGGGLRSSSGQSWRWSLSLTMDSLITVTYMYTYIFMGLYVCVCVGSTSELSKYWHSSIGSARGHSNVACFN